MGAVCRSGGRSTEAMIYIPYEWALREVQAAILTNRNYASIERWAARQLRTRLRSSNPETRIFLDD